MKRILSVVAISCILAGQSGLARAEVGQLLELKKDTVMGMKDGVMAKIPAADLQDVTGPYTPSGIFVEFVHAGSTYRLKISDTKLKLDITRTCLPGEDKYAQANQHIGATQMGSGESSCVP